MYVCIYNINNLIVYTIIKRNEYATKIFRMVGFNSTDVKPIYISIHSQYDHAIGPHMYYIIFFL